MAGLRFVRNRIAQEVDLAEIVEPRVPESAGGNAPITDWTWKRLPEPDLASLQSRAQAWEMTRYRAYQAQLAGRTLGGVFERVVAVLRLIAANATVDISAHAAH